jgi:hypothetical protein
MVIAFVRLAIPSQLVHFRIRSGIVGLQDTSEAADRCLMDMGFDPWVRHLVALDGGREYRTYNQLLVSQVSVVTSPSK